MKKLIGLFIIALSIAGLVFPQDVKISGEIKTGAFWYTKKTEGIGSSSGGFIHNSEDDTWVGQIDAYKYQPGRFRLNFQVDKGNVGTKFRFETTSWPTAAAGRTGINPTAYWSYAFAYGYFWSNQIKVSAGKMGDSPWGSGGPEMWKELDTAIGMRFEFIPSFIPFISPGSLNFGFVLNDLNASSEAVSQTGRSDSNLNDILHESVLGLSYTNKYLLVHFAYRLDSKADDDIGDRMLYRVEERFIQQYLPGFQIWANGYFEGLNTGDANSIIATNWLYVQYAPQRFTAQVRFGYDMAQSIKLYYVRATFLYNLFDNLINAGAACEYAQDAGPNRKGTDTYLRWYIEPQIRVNLNASTYIAFVYRYQDDYQTWNPLTYTNTLNSKTQWINLRTVFTF